MEEAKGWDMWIVTTQVFRLKAEVGFYDLGFKQR